MSQFDAWVRIAGCEKIAYPKSVGDFTGSIIASFIVEELVAGSSSSGEIHPGKLITLKGAIPGISPSFRYLLRFKRGGTGGGKYRGNTVTYDILPQAGVRKVARLPWTRDSLIWSLIEECKYPGPTAVDVVRKLSGGLPDGMEIPEASVEKDPCFPALKAKSSYYRLGYITMARFGWPNKVSDLHDLSTTKLQELDEKLRKTPYELCFDKFSRKYKTLGEMGAPGLNAVLSYLKEHEQQDPTQLCGKVQHGAVVFYHYMKDFRKRKGHTAFEEKMLTQNFINANSNNGYGAMAGAAIMWLVRNEHIYFLDARGTRLCLADEWFQSPRIVTDIQLPRDYALKMRIVGHLRRIKQNYEAARGGFTMRNPDDRVPATPAGACNLKQRMAVDHVLDNWLTVIQGGPGSGKSFVGIEHLATIFEWPEVLTHVGRQSVSLCDRLGGNPENSRTIHSAFYRHKGAVSVQCYNAHKQILIMDEVYNADDWTFEKALSVAPEACRLVLIGDPDQIRPIPDEKGAGTPALDIAKAFPEHVIFLDENMRQRDDARRIHSVVTAVRDKHPRTIKWGDSFSSADPVVRVDQPLGVSTESLIHGLMGRLMAHTKNAHEWQIISFYNGKDPEKHGDGIDQLNRYAEAYLERIDYVKPSKVVKVNPRLFIYPGSKIMFLGKYFPVKEVQKSKKTPDCSEVCNGQIEVVKEIKFVKIPGLSGNMWYVTCIPRGKVDKGTRFVIGKAGHVDPSSIVSAWAITSNKSMGGECKNVGVYLPPGIEMSLFDRSNIYVAVSRPTQSLAVIGAEKAIEAMTMRDPPPVRSGLLMFLRNDINKDLRQTQPPNPGIRVEGFDYYDQTGRTPGSSFEGACPVLYQTYYQKFKRKTLSFGTMKERDEFLEGFERKTRARLYKDEPRSPKRWDYDTEAEDMWDDHDVGDSLFSEEENKGDEEGEEVEDDSGDGGGEVFKSILKRGRYHSDEEEDDDDNE